ncbi:hypothetical protein K9N68_03095 [Kovacikia minuta CCNUW1]|uniref:hypothetical protein n=1 Tax=Kovacikia minuta TaxID=2931930 RepID=UPI001CCA36BC|nr:hypothetical protein [Kovacikia minuta]UBF26981.1 hypothetical protein K9N68_03095 [Kovacikia minuta CCNUW1]
MPVPAVATAQKPANFIIAAQSSPTTNFPIVKSTELSPYLNIPWSQPVQVVDPFEGSFLAVFDRNDIRSRALGYSGVGNIVSLWSRKSIQMSLTVNQGACASRSLFSPYPLYAGHGRFRGYPRFYRSPFFSPTYFYDPPCIHFITSRTVQKLLLKVGNQVLRLEGENSVFQVSDAVAVALRQAPTQNVDIRLVLEGGETVDSQIGKGTVLAWRSIY